MGAIYHQGSVYGGSMVIDDNATAANTGWSSNKIQAEMQNQKPLSLSLTFNASSRSVGNLNVTSDMEVTNVKKVDRPERVTSSVIGFTVSNGTIALDNATTLSGQIVVDVEVEYTRTS